ncbi:hypothetical protein G6723_01770 [Polynucleobacter paneuropaeus]|jgi:hypothetical protein|nr:hypothetical protein G6723_01770 [Polynucleobacter paneuropaeus]
MGIALLRSIEDKGKRHLLFTLLESPILLALILSIAIHIIIWKILPDFEPLPVGKSHGWMRVFLVDSGADSLKVSDIREIESSSANTSVESQSNNAASVYTQTQAATTNTTEAPLPIRPFNRPNLFGSVNANPPTNPETQEVAHNKDRRWETQVRAQSQQRQFQLNQAINFFNAIQMQKGMPYFCELNLNEDYTAAYIECEPKSLQQELKNILGGTPIRWQANKNGLPNVRRLGSPYIELSQ